MTKLSLICLAACVVYVSSYGTGGMFRPEMPEMIAKERSSGSYGYNKFRGGPPPPPNRKDNGYSSYNAFRGAPPSLSSENSEDNAYSGYNSFRRRPSPPMTERMDVKTMICVYMTDYEAEECQMALDICEAEDISCKECFDVINSGEMEGMMEEYIEMTDMGMGYPDDDRYPEDMGYPQYPPEEENDNDEDVMDFGKTDSERQEAEEIFDSLF